MRRSIKQIKCAATLLMRLSLSTALHKFDVMGEQHAAGLLIGEQYEYYKIIKIKLRSFKYTRSVIRILSYYTLINFN